MPRYLDRIHPKLLLLLLACSLTPLILACLLLTKLTDRALLSQSAALLQNIHDIRRVKTEDFLRTLLNDCRFLAEDSDTSTLLSNLIVWRDRERRAGSRLDFRGPSYESLSASYRQLWQKWLGSRHYRDIYLVDDQGLVLFTQTKGEELGANLRQGKLSTSGLATAWQRSKVASSPVLIDFSRLAAGQQTAFIAYPVREEDRGFLGVLICRIAPETITKAIHPEEEKIGEIGESYLVGELADGQFQFRSDMKSLTRNTVGSSLETPPAYWRQAAMEGKTGGSGRFRDSRNNDVLIAFNQLDVPDVRWYLISKVYVQEITAPIYEMVKIVVITGVFFIILIVLITYFIAGTITKNILKNIKFARGIAAGDYSVPLTLSRQDEFGDMARTLRDMAEKLHQTDWLQAGRSQLGELLRSEYGSQELASICLNFFVEYLGATMGALYLAQSGAYQRVATYAFHDPDGMARRFAPGEGLVGEAGGRNKLLVREIPDGSLLIHVGAGIIAPRYCLACPFSFQNVVIGALLLGLPEKPPLHHRHFLEQSMLNLGTVFNAAYTQERINRLMVTTQAQQRELAQSLAELEEKTKTLKHQREETQAANLRLAAAQQIVEQKVDTLEKANRQKTEFLATMSHELRTPLNSILILSKILSENRDGGLSEKDTELADTIHTSGESLLRLINEVLDIAKIDAGKMTLTIEDCHLDDLLATLDRMFRQIAEGKNLRFFLERDPDLPTSLRTDGYRLQQILANLLYNACKFTEQGAIYLKVRRPDAHFFNENNPFIPGTVAFMVEDSGIGIAKDNQRIIFNSFQQAENGISRKYGGTGLGLPICRRLAKLLGGFIHLESQPGRGSVFTLIIPESLEGYIGADFAKNDEEEITMAGKAPPEDDREQIDAGSKTLLHIEDDPISARMMRGFAHEYGFQYLGASSGEEGLQMARFHRPQAILLNSLLPDMNGETVLRHLQAQAELAVIPIFFTIMAAGNNHDAEARRLGAVGALLKPATLARIEAMFTTLNRLINQKKPVLGLIADSGDFPFLKSSAALIEKIAAPENLAETLTENTCDCLLLSLTDSNPILPVIIDQLAGLDTPPPLLILAQGGLDAEAKALIADHPDVVAVVATNEKEVLRLLAIFLHRAAFYPTADDGARNWSVPTLSSTPLRPRRALLIASGNLRDAFMLSSHLETQGVDVTICRDGEECLNKLDERKFNAALLDIHLPNQNGLATLAAIRANERFATLPIILYGDEDDRDSCLQTGADAFLPKPVSPEKLLELLPSEL